MGHRPVMVDEVEGTQLQRCTRCHTYSSDGEANCLNCGADLSEFSATAVALARFRANPRVGTVRLIPYDDCCPACREAEGEWPKAEVPDLPVPGCSHPMGCRCFYEPALIEMYP